MVLSPSKSSSMAANHPGSSKFVSFDEAGFLLLNGPVPQARANGLESQESTSSFNSMENRPGLSSGSSNTRIPVQNLPSPSAVHINNALEESLRKAEDERQRRSSGRRQKRRRRQGLQQQDQETHLSTKEQTKLLEEMEIKPEADEAVVGNKEQDATYDSIEEENYSDEDDDDGRNLTRQLAETAVSVREMSRELGRAKIKSSIQSVLIVTKARDNQLIKLTREIALYLMQTPRYGRSRGLVVYVDAQLKRSKRFDAAGIARDYPDLLRPDRTHHHHHAGLGGLQKRTSRKGSASTSAINLFGMTNPSSFLHDGKSSALPSGASTPSQLLSSQNSALSSGKQMTKLTEALVNRQLDRRLEKEEAKRTDSQARTLKDVDGKGASAPPNGAAMNGEEPPGLLRYWTAEMCSKSPHLFDLVVTLGGDGTVLFTSWLFQHVVPPVIPFALGSLGFLTNFDFSNHKRVMESAINDGVRVNLRMRFTATIYRAVDEDEQQQRRVVRSGETGQILMEKLRSGGWDAIEAGRQSNGKHCMGRDRDLTCTVTRPAESFEVLNDLVVDRGPSPYVSLLELFGDEHHMTTVQADGLCVATPTGSTAYSLSAGGSLVHPEIPTLLITPICPHTLSFRPMLLPDSMELRICVPYNSRSTAWASFDGRGRVEIKQGDHIKVSASQYPFPTVCADKQSTDWFQAITRTLKWNERQRQKSFVVVEHDREEPHDSTHSKDIAEKGYKTFGMSTMSSQSGTVGAAGTQIIAGQAQGGANDVLTAPLDEEDDETFDIDDIPISPSTNAALSAHNPQQSVAPVVQSPSFASYHNHENDTEGSRRGHVDSGHADAEPRHLRQYPISTSSSSWRSPKTRSYKRMDYAHPSRSSTDRAQTSRSTNSGERTIPATNDTVKAFVVYGADSSDVDTSASEDP